MKITVKQKYEEMVISKQYTNENKKKLKKTLIKISKNQEMMWKTGKQWKKVEHCRYELNLKKKEKTYLHKYDCIARVAWVK